MHIFLHHLKRNNMKKIIAIALIGVALVMGTNVFATGDMPANAAAKSSVTGKVVDIKTGEALVGVAVAVEGTDQKVYTDLDGNFTINNIDPGHYNLVLSLISYKNSLVENLKLNPGKKEVVDIKLDVIR
jgi:predicted nicotinamide N-methyase